MRFNRLAFGFWVSLQISVLSATAAPSAGARRVGGHVPEVVSKLQPVGRLPSERTMRLAVGLPVRDAAGLAQFVKAVSDPSSDLYRQYLTTEQFTERFGPTEADFQKVVSFLTTNGFTVTYSHPNRMIVDVSGSVADVERVFHVKMQTYRHPVESRTFFAPDSEPQIDGAIPILHISGLNDYVMPKPASLVLQKEDKAANPQPQGGSGPGGYYRGADFRKAYAPGISANWNGAGQYVGLLEFDGYYASDITTYESQASLPNVPLINVLLDDIGGGAGSGNIEVALDIEVCIAMAPGLSGIIVYEGQAGDDVLGRMATDNIAKQLSASWTFGIDALTEQIFLEFAAQGQSYFNASGDGDAYSGGISTPCDDPNIMSVGGTFLNTGGGATYSSETSWNRNNNTGTGGGISTAYGIPAWQQGVNMGTNMGSGTMRNIPDVAMVADSVYIVYNNGSSGGVGGTSVATPLWAAFTSLINQQAVARGHSTVGFLNPTLYSLGTNATYQSVFHDITSGSNTNSSSPTLFFACPGYDLCTGWGSPKGTNLINALAPALNAPLITNLNASIFSESCADGVLDPGEAVTVSFSVQNDGGVSTANLVGTLQANSGVISPGGPMNFGAVAGGGATASQLFSFTVGGTCGSTVTASLQLQDGTNNLGTLSYVFQTGVPNITFSQNFDGVGTPGLPAGWTSTVTGGGTNWITTNTIADSAPNSAYVYESAVAGTAALDSPPISIVTTNAYLVFRHFYNSETDPTNASKCYDGGVLEIKIGSSPSFLDYTGVGATAISNGYNKRIDSTDTANPLHGRSCWSGLSPGFVTTKLKLPASAAGQTIQLQWRYGTDTDNAYGDTGWFIDSVVIQDGYTCCTSAPPTLPVITSGPTNQTVPVGTNVTFSVTASGGGLGYQWMLGSSNLAGATASSLMLTNVQASDAGAYEVVITNAAGSTNATALLRVLVPPFLTLNSAAVSPTNVSISLPSVNGLNYLLEYKVNLTDTNWIPILPALIGNGTNILLQDTNGPAFATRFYRVLVN